MYEISELGEKDSKKVLTPRLFKIKAKPGQKKMDYADFRDELNINNYDGELKFDLFVNQRHSGKAELKIGKISLNNSIVSEACDRRLHFHHPKWKKLNH